jgi:nitrogen regulatory protein PII
MKMIVAYLRHEAFEPVRADLLRQGLPSLTVTEVKGSGRQRGVTERYRGVEMTSHLRPKLKLECVVADADVDRVVDALLLHGRTGDVGDGKVFVLDVQEAFRVRTGERGEDVLQAHRLEP